MKDRSSMINITKQQTPDLILYGGSFDPPHQGHIQAVEYVSKIFPEARFVIIPGRCPAVAGNKLKRPHLSFEERVKMCKLAFASKDLKAKVTVSLVEATLPLPNYTLNTVKEFKKNFSDKSLALLIGSDQFRVFHRWFKPLEILKNCSLIVVKRETDTETLKEFIQTADNVIKEFIPNNNYSYTISGSDSNSLLGLSSYSTSIVSFNQELFPIYLVDISICKASSTDIRNLIRDNESIPNSWVDKDILEYIKDNRLYSDP